MSCSFLVAALTAVTVGLSAQESPTAVQAGMDPARLSRIRSTMKGFVEAGKLPGIVALVARRGVVVLHEGFGQDGNGGPMHTDYIFQVRSMTKMLTAAAIMMLADDGALLLSDPVEKHLPEFRDQMVIRAVRSDKTLELRPPSRAITIHDLLTHTSGMRPDDSPDPARLEAPWTGPRAMQTLAAVVAFRAKLPLEFEPGTRWAYSGAGFETLGRIIEVVSGQPYERFVAERIFKPLGMADSFFFPPDEKRTRMGLTPLYPAGARFPGPGNGANSTARDIASFLQMMANGGTHGGRRLLSAASIREMTRVQTGAMEAGWAPGAGWGLGFEVRPSSGTFGHGTAGNFYAWVDPSRQLVGVFLGGSAEVRDAFMAMVAGAVID